MVGTMPAKTYRRTALVRAEEAVMRVVVSLGLVPHTYLLEVTGAVSGRLRTVPVTVVENGGRWLVAPYGERAWVRNVRASRAGRLRRGRHAAEVRFEEAGPEEAASVLQRYWRVAPATRPYFDVGPTPELDDFRRVAASHPVFRVVG